MNPVRAGRIAASIVAAVALITAAAAPASANVPLKIGTLNNINSGRCLEIAGWSTDAGATANQWDCNGGANQRWNMAAGQQIFVNVNSGKCLEIADWRTDNGAPVRQWDCTGGDNQKWYLLPFGNSWGIGNLHSGKCVEISGWRTDNGAPARQWDCNGGANQVWYMGN
ncbi:RICIN domain-containing protein [Kitasatospora sp. NPDC050543]|uniref:RICIN domain-containing protein n=1 Tax=Kitasatospora sp. NPDC050543 TaxID=3364054 RepID=UPI0037BB0301